MAYHHEQVAQRFTGRWRRAGGRTVDLLAYLGLALLLAVLGPARSASAQSLEELQLKKAEEEPKTESSGLKLGFGLQALIETAEGLNSDRPSSSNFFYLAPQLKIQKTYRLQANLGMIWNHLDRETNPWDLTDFGLQFSDLNIYTEKVTDVSFSGYLRYSFPTSKDSRVRDSYGALRLNLKASRTFGPIYLSAEVNGSRYFSKYTTSDTSAWYEDGNIASNPAWGINERYTLSYSPTAQLSLSAIWSMSQIEDYHGSDESNIGALSGYGRISDVTEHSYNAILDVTYGFNDNIYLSAGYSGAASQLQNGGRKWSMNPFDAKFGQLYVDLMYLY